MKLLVAGIGTFIAAIGGGLLALNYGYALPTSYATFAGLVWLAVFVTIGLRSITAAAIAGLSFTLVPGIFQTYLAPAWGNVPTLLFGLGGVAVALNPDGQVAVYARLAQDLVLQTIKRRRHGPVDQPPGQSAAGGPADVAEALGTSA
jgi:branched-chain amino acid transport system permease protein